MLSTLGSIASQGGIPTEVKLYVPFDSNNNNIVTGASPISGVFPLEAGKFGNAAYHATAGSQNFIGAVYTDIEPFSSEKFTVDFWGKAQDIQESASNVVRFQILLYPALTGNANIILSILCINGNDRNVTATIIDSSNGTGQRNVIISSNLNGWLNNFKFIRFIKTEMNKYVIYVDGVQYAINLLNNQPSFNVVKTEIRLYNSSTFGSVKGVIDDVCLRDTYTYPFDTSIPTKPYL